ncbi:MAG: hypothetical protein LBK61_06990 [Spirochaetaceae bacterium]|nr:hypothetical protein [Spirochaetaceae bacterium]
MKPIPNSGRKNSGMAGRAPPYGGVPLRGAKTRRVFIPLRILSRSWPRNQRQAGRIPPYGGCASPSGAQCRHKGVFCLPSRCRIRERMNKR